MTHPRGEKPTEWAEWGEREIHDAGGDVFYTLIGEGETAADVWVWHWHQPTNLPARWQASGCGNRQLVQKDPLTLSPSLACEDGCTWHGYLEGGAWRDA